METRKMGVHPRRREREKANRGCILVTTYSYASTNRSAVRFWKTRLPRQVGRKTHASTRASLALPRREDGTRINDVAGDDLTRPPRDFGKPFAKDGRTTRNPATTILSARATREFRADATRRGEQRRQEREGGKAGRGKKRAHPLRDRIDRRCRPSVLAASHFPSHFSESMRSERATSVSDHRLTDPGHSLVRYDIENPVTNISSKLLGNH